MLTEQKCDKEKIKSINSKAMKIIVKKPLRFTVITTLCLVVVTLFAAGGCVKTEYRTVNFTGEGIAINPQSIEHGKHASKPENPVRESYDFSGWFTDNGTFANEWNFKTDIVTQDTTLYAKWEENSLQEINLQGTKWKLTGIVDVQTGNLAELEPKDCAECYTFTFDTGTTFTTHSSANSLSGIYTVDYTENNIRLSDLFGTELAERGDGIMYVNTLYRIHSFSCKKNELKLYYNENENYLIFKSFEL